MSHTFKVTGLGLQVDKVNILPGSSLSLSALPPAHWSRFGEVEEVKTLTVATPEAAATAEEEPAKRRRPRKAD